MQPDSQSFAVATGGLGLRSTSYAGVESALTRTAFMQNVGASGTFWQEWFQW